LSWHPGEEGLHGTAYILRPENRRDYRDSISPRVYEFPYLIRLNPANRKNRE
jgi:hypothetical protein